LRAANAALAAELQRVHAAAAAERDGAQQLDARLAAQLHKMVCLCLL
jgi:hypothetical protein